MAAHHQASGGLFGDAAVAQQHDRFLLIDVMRGLAAVAVLVYHYVHFWFRTPGYRLSEVERAELPLQFLFQPFYDHGTLAVQMFWAISGFVFAATYISRPCDTWTFATNRFARLYPLHFLTLLAVAALQLLSRDLLGQDQLYDNNTLPNFLRHLFLASNWLQRGFSFNGPIWSVSVEVLIYGLFWLTLPRLYRFGILGPVLLATLFFAIMVFPVYELGRQIWKCGLYFFAGAALFLFFNRVPGRGVKWLCAAALLTVGASALTLVPTRFVDAPRCILMLGILLAAALAERTRLVAVGRRLRWFGDATYGMYLWHVPIQIGIIIWLDHVIGSRLVVHQPWFLLAFVGMMILIGHLSFRHIERPAGKAIRRLASRHEATYRSLRSRLPVARRSIRDQAQEIAP